jgi:hypothetical protein
VSLGFTDLLILQVAGQDIVSAELEFVKKCRTDLLGADLQGIAHLVVIWDFHFFTKCLFSGVACDADSQCLQGATCNVQLHKCNHNDTLVLWVFPLFFCHMFFNALISILHVKCLAKAMGKEVAASLFDAWNISVVCFSLQ